MSEYDAKPEHSPSNDMMDEEPLPVVDDNRREDTSDNGNAKSEYDRPRSLSPAGSASEKPAVAEPVDDDAEARNNGTNLFVTGLARSVKEDQLTEFFTAVGQVTRVHIMLDPHSRDSRGFAFVEMQNPDEADMALEKLSGQELDGKVVSIERAKRSRPRAPTPGRYFGPPKPRSRGGRRDSRGYRRDYDRGAPRGYRERGDRYRSDRGDRFRGDRYDRDRYDRDRYRGDRYDRDRYDRDRYDRDRYDDGDRRDRDRGDRSDRDRFGGDRDRYSDRGDRDRYDDRHGSRDYPGDSRSSAPYNPERSPNVHYDAERSPYRD